MHLCLRSGQADDAPFLLAAMSAHQQQRVIVTYSAPLTFLQSDQWKQFYPSLKSQLPLHNLHWKSSQRPSIRTIQELDVNLVALDSVRDEHASQVPTTLLERPLLNIYVVICEVRPLRTGQSADLTSAARSQGRGDVQDHHPEADQGLARRRQPA
jgi:hypothetical protein